MNSIQTMKEYISTFDDEKLLNEFDLFHVGHVRLLKRCREISGQSGTVIVSLNTDEFIEQYKGKPPIISYQDRAEILLSCKYVDQVIPNFGNEDSKPAFLVKAT